MTFAICFDFPESPDPWFAYRPRPGSELGLTSSLAQALRFESEVFADAALAHCFGKAGREYGVVVEVAS